MLKIERNALSRTLNEAGIKGQVKYFVTVTRKAFAETLDLIGRSDIKAKDLMAEYNLNLQEARLFHNG